MSDRHPVTPRQLALPFAHDPRYDDEILAGDANQAALAWTAQPLRWPARRLALWGEAGTGKTHLLHLWSRSHGALLLDGAALRDRDPRQPAVGAWHDAATLPLPHAGAAPAALAIDDADLAAEEALLHLLNTANEAGQPVLLAARAAPARWGTALPDLRSRLRATTAVELGPPDDALLHALLDRLLADRQLAVSPATRDWLLAHLPRTPAALREAAARLDRVSLAEGRRVTRALAAGILADAGPSDEPATNGPTLF